MTATVLSLAELIADRVGRDWHFYPSPTDGVLDFEVDDRHFRIIVLAEADEIESVVVYRSGDGQGIFGEYVEEENPSLTDEEYAAIAKAQDLAAQAEPIWPMGG